MLLLSKKEALKLCEDQGEAWVRARVKIDGPDANIDMLAWLGAKELEREKQTYEEQKAAQSRTIKAAEKSAQYSYVVFDNSFGNCNSNRCYFYKYSKCLTGLSLLRLRSFSNRRG